MSDKKDALSFLRHAHSRRIEQKYPVSYTHLDVYKRQVVELTHKHHPEMRGINRSSLPAVPDRYSPVSYTHLFSHFFDTQKVTPI